MKFRSRALLISTIVAVSIMQLAQARLAKSEIVRLIEDTRNHDANLKAKRIPSLKKAFSSTKDPRSKLLSALSLGVTYFNLKEYRAALQYLNTAQHLAGDKEPLRPYIDFYLASLNVELGQYDTALYLTESLLKRDLTKERKRDVYELLMASLAGSHQYSKVLTTYKDYERHFSLRKATPLVLKLAAIAYNETKELDKELLLLESLAEQYPLNPEAVWAFKKLIDYHCLDKDKRPYFFSQKLLQRLSVNRNLELGIEEFLISQSYLPIRDLRNQTRVLSPLERLEFLISLNLPHVAATQTQTINDALLSPLMEERRYASFLRARLAFEIKDYANATRQFSRYLTDYPKDVNTRKILEGLAASQFAVGEFKAAAELYARLVKDYRQEQFTWDHFWSLYLAGSYDSSLALLDRNNYIRLKDPNEPLAKNYWRGRILEKMNRPLEAEEEFRKILRDDGTSYYANLVLSHKPQFWAEFMPAQPEEKTSYQAVSSNRVLLASNDFSALPQIVGTPTTINLLQDLVTAGLYQDAIQKFEEIKFQNIKDSDQLDAMQGLAIYLADFRAYRRIMLESNKGFRGIPKNLAELAAHQRTYGDQWKAIFPLAYDKLTSTIEDMFKVDKLLILSLMRTESRFDMFAKSWVGARGLMQLMPKTAIKISELIGNQSFDVPQLYEPSVNIGYGGYYFKRLYDYYGSNFFLAIGSYNAGPIAMNRWLQICKACSTDELVETITFRETRRYVKEVIKYFGIYTKVYKNTQPFWEIPRLPKEVNKDVDLF